jgi:hypothetical protein
VAPLTETDRHALQALHDGVATPAEAEHARALLASRAEACVYYEMVADLDDIVSESMEARFGGAAPAVPRPRRAHLWAAAAAAALLASVGTTTWLLRRGAAEAASAGDARIAQASTITWIDDAGPKPVRAGQAIAASRGPATAVLADGSTLRAAAGTRMVFHRRGTFTLESGEVLAESGTANSMLRLNAGASTVSARHSRMHVWTDGKDAAVALLEGDASVEHPSSRVSRELAPGSVAWVESSHLLATASLPPALSQRLESGPGTLGGVLPGVRQLALGDEPAAEAENPALAAVRAARPSVTLNIDGSKSVGSYEAVFSRILGGTVRRLGTTRIEPGAPASLAVPDTAGAGTLMVELVGTGGYAVSVRPPGERGLLLVPTPDREATVTVRDREGRALPYAQIWLRDPHAPRLKSRLVTADKEGRAAFRLTRDAAVMDVAATGYLPLREVSLLPGADPLSLTVPLEPAPFVLQGSITDVTPEDLAAGVELETEHGERLMVDASGAFAVTQAADARPFAITIRRPGKPDLLATLDPMEPEPHRIDLAKAATPPASNAPEPEQVSVSCRVWSRTGGPLAGIIVGILNGRGERIGAMRTDTEGRFWGRVPADGALVLEAPGYDIANAGLPWRLNPYLGTITVDSANAALLTDIVLNDAPEHSIAVQRHDGTPVAHAPVRMDYRASASVEPVTAVLLTDEKGHVLTPTLPADGVMRLTVLRADLGYPTQTLDVDSYPSALPRLSVWYLGRPSDVRARLEDGLAPEGCYVEVERVAEPGTARSQLVDAPGLPWRTPSRDGRLTLPALAPGDYRLRAHTPRGTGPWSLVRVSPGLVAPVLTIEGP